MKKNNKKSKNQKIQLTRRITQFVFLGLLIAGVYMDLRMVLMVLLPGSLLFGNFFCGWVCPYGTIQEVMGNIGMKIFKKRYKMPRNIQKYMQYLRYVLFVILIIGVLDFVLTPMNGYGTFMRLFSEDITTAASSVALGIMILYLLLSVFFERAFCNYLCTESPKYGVLSMTRIFSIKRNESTCVNCKKCDKACPMNIEVSAHDHVRNGQCINCLKCINACPIAGTLSYSKVKLPIGKK
jgi:polyferredoxin